MCCINRTKFFASHDDVDRLLLCSFKFLITHISLLFLCFFLHHHSLIIDWTFSSYSGVNNLQKRPTFTLDSPDKKDVFDVWSSTKNMPIFCSTKRVSVHDHVKKRDEIPSVSRERERERIRRESLSVELETEVRLVLNSCCCCLSYLCLSCFPDSHWLSFLCFSQLSTKTRSKEPSGCLFGDQWRCLPLLFI